MKNLVAHWELIRTEAANCAKLKDLVRDSTEQAVLAWLAEQLDTLALELERVITANTHGGKLN
jgi:hypothetical protein